MSRVWRAGTVGWARREVSEGIRGKIDGIQEERSYEVEVEDPNL